MSRKAFTFVELLIVLMLMGILAAVAAPKFVASMSRYRTESAAKRIVADLQYARQLARSKSASVTFNFEPELDRYILMNVADIDHPQEEFSVTLTESPYVAQIVSVTGYGANNRVVFDFYGRPNAAGSVVVASGGYQATITITESGQTTVSGVVGP